MIMKDSYITIAWLVLLIILLIIEIITVGLTSIWAAGGDRKSTRLNSSHIRYPLGSRMPSAA